MKNDIRTHSQQHLNRLQRRAERETLASMTKPNMAFVNIVGGACIGILVVVMGWFVINSVMHQIDVRACSNASITQFEQLDCGEVMN